MSPDQALQCHDPVVRSSSTCDLIGDFPDSTAAAVLTAGIPQLSRNLRQMSVELQHA